MGNTCPTCGFGIEENAASDECLYCTSGVRRGSKQRPTVDRPASDLTMTIGKPQLIGDHDSLDGPFDDTRPNVNAFERYKPEAQRYQIRNVLGEGAMGRVIKARDHDLQRSVAIKLLHRPLRKDEELVDRFVDEARITGQLQHPNIIPVHELNFDEQGSPFYSMKQVRGDTLRTVITQLREGDADTISQYPLSRLLTIFMKVCDGVAYAHSRGVLHRDLKPENIMIGDYGEVVVTDWGLAKVLSREEEELEDSAGFANATMIDSNKMVRTQYGRIIGTPHYMSPEQASGRINQIDQRSDVYTLGVILFEVLTLTSAFNGKSIDSVLDQVMFGRVSNLSLMQGTVNPGADGLVALPHLPQRRVHESLRAIVHKAMSLDPDDRYPSVPDLQADLEAYQNGFATQAEGAGVVRQAQLFVRRNRMLSYGLALIAALLAVYSWVNLQERQKAEQALSNYETESRLRMQQERESAPAFLASAKSLADEGNFTNAMTIVEQAISFDPALASGYQLKAILHLAQGQNFSATEALRGYLELVPDDDVCRALYERLVADPERKIAMHQLAELASGKGYVGLAPYLRGEGEARQADLKKWLPIYRQRIKAAAPTKEFWEALVIHPEYDLSFRHVDLTHLGTLDDLNMLKGIPLNDLEIGFIDEVDLSPLAGMPLRRFVAWKLISLDSLEPLRGLPLEHLAVNGKFADLSPLEGMPLKTLKLRGGFDDFRALRGMFFDALSLDGNYVDLEPLSDMKFHSLSVLNAEGYTSLKFINEHPELRELRLRHFPLDDDYTPLLTNSHIDLFEEDYDYIEYTTFGRFNGEIYAGVYLKILEGALDAALAEVRGITEMITNEAVASIRDTGRLLEQLLLRQRDPNHRLPASDFTIHHGGKTYVWLACRRPATTQLAFAEKMGLKVACVHSAGANSAIASLLGIPARSGHFKVDALIGASREAADDVWTWSDGEAWDYKSWKAHNEDRMGLAYIRNDGKWEVHHPGWSTTVVFEIPD